MMVEATVEADGDSPKVGKAHAVSRIRIVPIFREVTRQSNEVTRRSLLSTRSLQSLHF